MNQINEALAALERHGFTQSNLPHYRRVVAAAQEHQNCVRGWVTCPTCNGSGWADGGELVEKVRAAKTGKRVAVVGADCPDCVDGMVPSPGAILRVGLLLAMELGHNLASVDPPILGPSTERLARAVLLASRRGEEEYADGH